MIKRKFSALIPAFDPRPGRTNVNQTTDLELTPPPPRDGAHTPPPPPPTVGQPTSKSLKLPGSVTSSSKTSPDREMKTSPRLSLVLRGPNLPGIDDVEVELTSLSDSTIFKAVQTIIQQSNIGSKADKIRRIWEPTYVIAYGEASDKESSPLSINAGDSCSEATTSHTAAPTSPACVLPQIPLLSQVRVISLFY